MLTGAAHTTCRPGVRRRIRTGSTLLDDAFGAHPSHLSPYIQSIISIGSVSAAINDRRLLSGGYSSRKEPAVLCLDGETRVRRRPARTGRR